MQLLVDHRDPMPLYAQLARAIRVAIATDALRVGDQLPTVRQMAVDLRINANTVAKVYGELERTGVLETRRGVGTFVAARAAGTGDRGERSRRLAELARRYLAEAQELGYSADDAIEMLRRGAQDKGR
jgi:GntR family transcriptional regulator